MMNMIQCMGRSGVNEKPKDISMFALSVDNPYAKSTLSEKLSEINKLNSFYPLLFIYGYSFIFFHFLSKLSGVDLE